MSITTAIETLSDGSTVEVSFYAYGRYDRLKYSYTINWDGKAVTGFDLSSGSGSEPDALDMLRTLFGFLSAWSEALGYGRESENRDLFPDELAEWAVLNEDEFVILSYEGE